LLIASRELPFNLSKSVTAASKKEFACDKENADGGLGLGRVGAVG